jgi:hypothetical protein
LACNDNQESRDVFAALRQLDDEDESNSDAANYGGEDNNGDAPSGDDENDSEDDEKENGYYDGGDYDYYPSAYESDYSPSTYVNPENTKDKFISDLMAFWDNYLVYNDDDFAQYLYEFPTYVAEK